jgi:hypothetical protein
VRQVLRLREHDSNRVPLEAHLPDSEDGPPDRQRLLGIRIGHELVGQPELPCYPGSKDARNA